MFDYVFTYLFMLNAYLAHSEANILIFQVEGHVSRESFVYFKLTNGGNLLLELNSLGGDADIYVTGKNILPGFYPEYYDLHSATCGQDVIYVPGNFRRPVMVGIYGHPSHEVSNYTLNVYQLPLSSPDEESNFELEFNRNAVDIMDSQMTLETNKKQDEEDNNESNENNSNGDEDRNDPNYNGRKESRPTSHTIRRKVKTFAGKTGLWAFLELFEMIFL